MSSLSNLGLTVGPVTGHQLLAGRAGPPGGGTLAPPTPRMSPRTPGWSGSGVIPKDTKGARAQGNLLSILPVLWAWLC